MYFCKIILHVYEFIHFSFFATLFLKGVKKLNCFFTLIDNVKK